MLDTVDAPELDQPFGNTAKKLLVTLIFDRWVLVEVVNHASMPARLKLEGAQVDEIILRRGLGWVRPYSQKIPELSRLEHHSRSARRGLWQSKGPISPWRW